jgi:hypothetical protein
MLSTMARHNQSQRACKEPSLGLSVLYAHPPIRRWRLDPSIALAFGLRLGGTLHCTGLRGDYPRRPAIAGRMQSRIRCLFTPAPATRLGRGPVCSRRRARIPNQLIVRMREESSPLRTWQARVRGPGGSVGEVARRPAHPETGGVFPGILASEETIPARFAKRKHP